MTPPLTPRLRRALTPRLSRYNARTLFPKQIAFLLCQGREVLYGGAAGGGKSFAILQAALQFFDVPGYSAVIFRRTHPQLVGEGGLIDLSRELLQGTGAVFDEQQKTWRSPEGAQLKFAHLQHEKNKYDHQGKEYHFIGFDEVTHFTEGQYRYLMSRLRKKAALPVPLRVRATANPEPGWVKLRFIDNPTPPTRVFISSRLEDNPHLDQDGYRTSLALLSAVERRRLELGDWEVVERGPIFGEEHFLTYHSSPLIMAQECDRVITSWDPKNTFDTRTTARKGESWCVGEVWGQKGSNIYLLDEVRGLWSGDDTAKQVLNLAKKWPEARAHLVEAKAAGPYVVRNLKGKLAGVRGVGKGESKEKVYNGVVMWAAAGNIWVPCAVANPWVSHTVSEWCQAPATPNDRTDAMAQAAEELLGGGGGRLSRAFGG